MEKINLEVLESRVRVLQAELVEIPEALAVEVREVLVEMETLALAVLEAPEESAFLHQLRDSQWRALVEVEAELTMELQV